MNTQSHRIDSGTLLPEPGSRFKRRYEACRQTLSNRGHATARPACASISKSTATRSNGGRVNLPGSHPGKHVAHARGRTFSVTFLRGD